MNPNLSRSVNWVALPLLGLYQLCRMEAVLTHRPLIGERTRDLEETLLRRQVTPQPESGRKSKFLTENRE